MSVTFSQNDIAFLYPAYLLIDRHWIIRSYGPSISRQVPDVRSGDPFDAHFRVSNSTRYQAAQAGFPRRSTIELRSLVSGLKLTGSIIDIDDAYLLAVNISSLPESGDLTGLSISDFGPNDPIIDTVLLLSMQNAMLKEAKELATNLALERQKSDALSAQISRVASCLAHDFNNYLSIIKLNCNLLKIHKSNHLQLDSIINIIEETSEKSSGIALSLLSLSSSASARANKFSIDEFLYDSLPYFQAISGGCASIKLKLQAPGVLINADLSGIMNCLTNIVLNARDAIVDAGDVTISTQTEPVDRSHKEHFTQPSHLLLTISDSGAGMNEDVLSKAFDPYFSTKEKGTGIGLTSVQEFLEAHGGTIELQSSPGLGTQAILRFPIAKEERAASIDEMNRRSTTPGPSAERPRIIVVDDERYAMEALSELLETEGFYVLGATSPNEALTLIGRHLSEGRPFDILLTDIVMPEGNGIALGRAAQEACRGLKVILMSGLCNEPMPLGINFPLLAKPLKIEEILATVRHLLGADFNANQGPN